MGHIVHDEEVDLLRRSVSRAAVLERAGWLLNLQSSTRRAMKYRRGPAEILIALVLEGWSRRDAAEACAMDRQTLRDWVHRYNGLGPEGLGDAPRRNGPPARLSASQQAQIAAWVRQGPDPERDGVVRWRCIDLQRRINGRVCGYSA